MDLIIALIVIIYSYFHKFRFDSYLCNRLLFIDDYQNQKIKFEEKEIKYRNLQNLSNQIDKVSDNFPKKESKIMEKNTNNKKIEIKEIKIIKELEEFDNNNHQSEIRIKNDEENQDNHIHDNSNRNLFKDNHISNIQNEEQSNNKEIRSYIEITIQKLNEFKNAINFKFFNKLIKKKNKKLLQINDFLNFYSKKLKQKFDNFYYFQLDKKVEISERILFDTQELEIIELLSKKIYKIDIEKFEKKIEDNQEEKNKMIIDYLLMSESNPKKEKLSEILLN
jgi:hypothetical protein